MSKIARALISVTDKTGIVDFARGLRNQGVEAGLYLETIRQGLRKGYRGGECSWTLRRNTAIQRVLETVGARPYRKYRLYQGPIPPRA